MAELIPEDIAELFESGVSILVGTRDEACVPEAVRAVGAVVLPDRQRLTVYLPVDLSARTLSNLRENRRIAVAFSSVLDHRTLQVKGTIEQIGEATQDDRTTIARYHAAFSEILYLTGIPRALTRRLNVWPAAAVTFRATDIFRQTPGPNAGERVPSFAALAGKH